MPAGLTMIRLLLALMTFGAMGNVWAESEVLRRAAARTDSPLAIADDRGRLVAAFPRARRIASLAPHVTDLVVALGAADRLIAVDRHSDAPEVDGTIPRLASHPAVDPERLLALKPDLVIAWGEGLTANLLSRLEALGLRVFVSTPRTLEDVKASIERLGALIDTPVDGRTAAAAFGKRLAEISARHSQGPALMVFVQLWETPLITPGTGSVLDDVLRRCGARNVFSSTLAGSQRVSPEAVLGAAPSLVISTVPGSNDTRWRRLGLVGDTLPAARFVRVIDPALERPSPPILDALERLCLVIDGYRSRGGQRPAG